MIFMVRPHPRQRLRPHNAVFKRFQWVGNQRLRLSL
jgi:hypothetical protein